MRVLIQRIALALLFLLSTAAHPQSPKPVIEACPLWLTGNYIGGMEEVVQKSFSGTFSIYPSCQPATVSGCQAQAPNTVAYNCFGTTGGNCSCSQTPCTVVATGVTLGGTSKIGVISIGVAPNRSTHCGYLVQPNAPEPPKNNGNPRDKDPDNCCGNPVNTGTGNKFQEEIDIPAPYEGGLSFPRYFNSAEFGKRFSSGANWRHTWMRWIEQFVPSEAYAQRPDGVRRTFVAGPGGTWVGEADTPDKLVKTASGWILTTRENEVETYNAAGRITELIDAAGRRYLFQYSNGTAASGTFDGTTTPLPVGLLTEVSDHRGRKLQFRYNPDSLLTKVIDPAGLIYAYSVGGADRNLLSVTYPDGRSKTYHYNESANTSSTWQPNALTGITDEKGVRFATYKYDSSGRAIRSEHAGGVLGFTFTYGTSGATSYVDPLGTSRTTTHTVVNGVAKRGSTTQNCPGCGGTATKTKTFDVNSNLASVVDFKGNLACFTHDLARNLETARTEGLSGSGNCTTRVTTTATRTITTEWHPQWRVRKRTAEPLRITTYAYHGEAGVSCAPAGASQTLLCSRTVQATPDSSGASAFSATADGAPRTWAYTYNANGQLLTADGPRTDVSDVSSLAYYASNDPSGNYRAGDLASSTNAAGHTIQYTHYDASGRLKRMVDPNGLETLLDYWPRGWLKSRSVGTAVAGFETTNYDYEFSGQLSRVTMPDGSFVSYAYDNAQRLVQMSDGLGNRVTYALDGAGNRISESAYDAGNQLARAHTREFDVLGRLFRDIGGTNPAQQVTVNGYDANGNLASIQDPLARTTSQVFDARNRLTEVRDPFNGTASPTRYQYNGQDQLTQVIDPKGLATNYTLNGHGETLVLSSPDTGVTNFTYDPASNLKTRLDARGVTATYTYDPLGRITVIAYPDETVTYTYDSCANGIGRLCSVSDRTGTTSWSYDVKGRVTGKTQVVSGLSQAVAYGYNAGGQLASVTTPSGQVVQYGYANNRPVSVTINGTVVLDQATYEPFGPNGGWRWGNWTAAVPNTHFRTFDNDFRAQQVGSDLPQSGGAKVIAKTLGWDAASRILTITDIANAALSGGYGYDALDRLTSATQGASSWGYTFDGVGNRLTSTVGAASTSYGYFTGSHRLQSLTGAQSKSYSYDAAGNMTSDGNATWTYGGHNRPTQVQVGPVVTAIAINALGQRVRKSTGGTGTRFVYDEAGRLWGEYSDAGALISETVWLDDLPVAVIRPGAPAVSIYYVHPDHLGTPRAITRPSDNALVWRWENSEPFGKSVPDENPSGLGTFTYNLRFPGQYFDSETGTHYNYFRDYEPGIGRYVQSDPIGLRGGVNTYGYVGGSPLVNVDPEGLAFLPICIPPVCVPIPIPIPNPGRGDGWGGSSAGSGAGAGSGSSSNADVGSCPPSDDENCNRAKSDARRIYNRLENKRIPQYLSGGTRGADPGHYQAIGDDQQGLRDAIRRVKRYCKIFPPELRDWEATANRTVPRMH